MQSTFTELRQAIDILLLDDYDEYIKNLSFRMRRFDRVKYEDAMLLIRKMQKEGDSQDEDAFARSDGIHSPSGEGLERENSVFENSAARFQRWALLRRPNRGQ